MFRNNAFKFEKKLQDKLKERNFEIYEKVFPNNLEDKAIKINTLDEGKPIVYFCSTCKRHLSHGKLPPMATANGLALVDLQDDPDLRLSEMENNLIAKRILFQKIFQLPRSRMAACKDKLVNVPIHDTDIMNTFENLPRTPKEAGLYEVKLKRRKQYSNFHKKQYVNSKKIYKALNFLMLSKHPSYLCFDSITDYEKRCQETDPKGYDLIFVYEDGVEKIVDIDEYLKKRSEAENGTNTVCSVEEEEKEEEEEEKDKKKDPARKFQFQYDKSVCMVDKFPEAAVTENNEDSQCLSFAPGEGKIPENILMTDNWDIDAFPMKYPDGKNGLHQERERKLTDQYHFVQRLRNKDARFSSDPSYFLLQRLT